MASNASVEFHIRLVSEKHQELVTALDNLISVLVGEDHKKKEITASNVRTKANELMSAISKQDYPNWLNPLNTGLSNFVGKSWNSKYLINHLMENFPQIKNHKWVFEDPSKIAFDFDSIYKHYKKQSRLPELFDEIIKILEEIQKSGEVDSVAMMNALGKVIATLKQNKDGSFFSVNSAWSFLISFLKNYMWAELAKIPTLGSAMEALNKAINEANDEMHSIHTGLELEMKNTIESEVKGLQQKTEFHFIGYDKSGAELPMIENKSSLNEKA